MTKPRSAIIRNIFTLFAILISFIGSTITVTPARAASILVNSNADTVANDGICTLREAITSANNNASSGAAAGECAAGFGADVISFAGNYTITLGGSELVVGSPITINGKGAANTIIQANAAPNAGTSRVFRVSVSANLTLNEMTVRHGNSATCIASQNQTKAFNRNYDLIIRKQ